jgi:FMN phosphatase YigB (HAD superfamily)
MFAILTKNILIALVMGISSISVMNTIKAHTQHKKTIIWDLGGVLFEPSTCRVLSHIGFLVLIKHILHDCTYPALKAQIFTLLHQLDFAQQPIDLYDNSCTKLPPCMSAWLTGRLTGLELISHAHNHIDQLPTQQYFASIHEKNLIKQAISALFHPISFAHSMRPIPAGLRLLKKCARMPHTRLLLLSNWDAQSFSVLTKSNHGQSVLRYFLPEHHVISGLLGYAKPDKRCFEYIIKKYNLSPQECIFIDDQHENIVQAEKHGFTCIWLQNKNYEALEQLLKLHNVF